MATTLTLPPYPAQATPGDFAWLNWWQQLQDYMKSIANGTVVNTINNVSGTITIAGTQGITVHGEDQVITISLDPTVTTSTSLTFSVDAVTGSMDWMRVGNMVFVTISATTPNSGTSISGMTIEGFPDGAQPTYTNVLTVGILGSDDSVTAVGTAMAIGNGQRITLSNSSTAISPGETLIISGYYRVD